MKLVTQEEYEILLNEYREALRKLHETKNKLDNVTTTKEILSYTD